MIDVIKNVIQKLIAGQIHSWSSFMVTVVIEPSLSWWPTWLSHVSDIILARQSEWALVMNWVRRRINVTIFCCFYCTLCEGFCLKKFLCLTEKWSNLSACQFFWIYFYFFPLNESLNIYIPIRLRNTFIGSLLIINLNSIKTRMIFVMNILLLYFYNRILQ